MPHIEHVEQPSQPFVKHVSAGNGEVYSVWYEFEKLASPSAMLGCPLPYTVNMVATAAGGQMVAAKVYAMNSHKSAASPV